MAARKVTPFPASSFPSSFPYSPEQLRPYDPSSDAAFYSQPRFVNHIDDHAIEALGQYYDEVPPRKQGEGATARILDLCSSWVSHIPLKGDGKGSGMSVTGVGMNAAELEANPILTDWAVHDLNVEPKFSGSLKSAQKGKVQAGPAGAKLPYDAVICNVSIDYLYQPLEVLEETANVLKSGGFVHLAISNRCFPTKVVSPWLELSTRDRLQLVASYFHFAGTANGAQRPGALFTDIESLDVVPERTRHDPLWIVRARRR